MSKWLTALMVLAFSAAVVAAEGDLNDEIIPVNEDAESHLRGNDHDGRMRGGVRDAEQGREGAHREGGTRGRREGGRMVEGYLMRLLEQEHPEEFERLQDLRRENPEAFEGAVRETVTRLGIGEKMREKMRQQLETKRQISRLETEAVRLAKQYQETEDEAERARIDADLTEALDKAFDMKLEEHRMRAKELEKRLKSVNEWLAKREADKDAIVGGRKEELLRKAAGRDW